MIKPEWWQRLTMPIIGYDPRYEPTREAYYRDHAGLSYILGSRTAEGFNCADIIAHRNYIAAEFARKFPGVPLAD